MIVAIDGPAGAGKTGVSMRVARMLASYAWIQALYRAVAYEATRLGLAHDSPALEGLVADLAVGFGYAGVTLHGEVIRENTYT